MCTSYLQQKRLIENKYLQKKILIPTWIRPFDGNCGRFDIL